MKLDSELQLNMISSLQDFQLIGGRNQTVDLHRVAESANQIARLGPVQ
jgi:hypothetical protein